MPSRPFRVAAAALTASAAAAAAIVGLVGGGASAGAATPPPWETNPTGTITFYDSSGAAITHGSTTAPIAAYAVGSTVLRTGDAKAELLFANPQPGVLQTSWYRQEVGPYTSYPIASAPAAVTTAADGKPAVASATGDLTLEQFAAGTAKSTASGYQNVVQVRMRTANATNQPTATYDVADVLIDTTNHTWSEVYPSSTVTTTPASLDIAATNAIRYGTTNTYLARLYAGSTAIANRTLQFYGRSDTSRPFGLLGAVKTDSGGRARISFKPVQTDQFYFHFAGDSTYAAVNSRVVTTTVNATFTLSAVNHASIKAGQSVAIYGTVAPAINGQKVYLQQLISGSYRTTAYNAGIRYAKLPNGATTYGYTMYVKLGVRTTYQFRMYVPATSIRGAAYSTPFSVKVS